MVKCPHCQSAKRQTKNGKTRLAQVCLYAMGGKLAFCEATMYQIRNEHSLIRDFKDEVPGYLDNMRIMVILTGLSLSSDAAKAGENLRLCYEKLIEAAIVPADEMPLIDAWLSDLAPV